jgi:beta-glucosidase
MMFDDDFIWGGGAPSVSIEGAGLRSDWFRWERRAGVAPSDTGNDFRSRTVEDFQLLVEHGLRHVRLTLEWARVEPFAGQIDHQELEVLEERLATAKDAGVAVWATLHHGSLPGWFAEDTDGFCTTGGPSIHWSRHVDRMAELFDEYVTTWIPIEDPIGWAIRGYFLGTRPPGVQSLEKVQGALEGVIEATFEAQRLLASGATPVVGSFALPTLHAVDDAAMTQRSMWDDVIWQSWSRAIRDGVLEWPWGSAVDRPDMADTFDAIGAGISAPYGVTASSSLEAWPQHTRRDAEGRTPRPDELLDTLARISELVDGRDLVVMGLGAITEDDGWREQLFEGWLDQIAQAVAEGLPIRGTFIEPLIDGYDIGAGLHLDTGVFTRSREPKPSFGWIAAQQ